jgi:hypothetical protein
MPTLDRSTLIAVPGVGEVDGEADGEAAGATDGTEAGVGDGVGAGCAGPRDGTAARMLETAATSTARRGFLIAD